jgi:hypothetical protein
MGYSSALTRTVHHAREFCYWYIVSALMFVMRHFAGPMAHKLFAGGTALVLLPTSVAGTSFVLSIANSPITGLLAATVWGTGCLLHVANHVGSGIGDASSTRRALC